MYQISTNLYVSSFFSETYPQQSLETLCLPPTELKHPVLPLLPCRDLSFCTDGTGGPWLIPYSTSHSFLPLPSLSHSLPSLLTPTLPPPMVHRLPVRTILFIFFIIFYLTCMTFPVNVPLSYTSRTSYQDILVYRVQDPRVWVGQLNRNFERIFYTGKNTRFRNT